MTPLKEDRQFGIDSRWSWVTAGFLSWAMFMTLISHQAGGVLFYGIVHDYGVKRGEAAWPIVFSGACTCLADRHKTFEWTLSTSYSTEWTENVVEFGSGNITGVESLDTQELGGVHVGKLFFLNGISFHVPSFVEDPFDGVFGLRLGPHSPLNGMARSGVIGKPWLGLYFSPEENIQGEALFGGDNESHFYGSLGFIEAFGDAFQFNIDGYEVGPLTKTLPPKDSRARLALTDPFVGGPAGDIQALNTLIGGRKVEGGRYEVRCERDPPLLVLMIGSKGFGFKPGDYIIKENGPSGTRCYSGFVEAEERANATWHLGLLFLRRVYTVLEAPLEPLGHGRVGFANARLPV